MLCCCYHIIYIYYANHVVANSTYTALCYSSCDFLKGNKSEVPHIHNKKNIAMLKYMDIMEIFVTLALIYELHLYHS